MSQVNKQVSENAGAQAIAYINWFVKSQVDEQVIEKADAYFKENADAQAIAYINWFVKSQADAQVQHCNPPILFVTTSFTNANVCRAFSSVITSLLLVDFQSFIALRTYYFTKIRIIKLHFYKFAS